MVKKIIKILGKTEAVLTFTKDRPGHDRKYSIDWSKINSELGWKPLADFDAWLEKTVEWYINNSSWWKKIKDKKWDEYYKGQYQEAK